MVEVNALGGYTTFSAYGNETFLLFREGKLALEAYLEAVDEAIPEGLATI